MSKKLVRYLILPGNFVRFDMRRRKLFYLAGPVEGGDGWQKRAIPVLRKKFPRAYFALPYSSREAGRLRRSELKSEPGDGNDFDWRNNRMKAAAQCGCLVFWLGPQDKLSEADFSKEPYGWRASREQAEWMIRLAFNRNLRVVIGIYHSFPGHDEIVGGLRSILGANFPIYTRFPDLLKAAIKMAK